MIEHTRNHSFRPDDFSFRAEKDGETYNALMKLGEKSKEVQELLDENQELLDEMRGFVERCL